MSKDSSLHIPLKPSPIFELLFSPKGEIAGGNCSYSACPDICVEKTCTFYKGSDSSVVKATYILPIGGAISCICYIILFYLYFGCRVPTLMRHPTSLLIYKCVLEFFFVQQYMWVPFMDSSSFYDEEYTHFPYCHAATLLSTAGAFVSQFCILGAELCLLVLSIDLRLAYTNPFSSYRQNRPYFVVFVVSVSTIIALVLMMMGPMVYGPSMEGAIWIQNRWYNQNECNYSVVVNMGKFFCFYIFIFPIYIYSLGAYWALKAKIKTGFSDTFSVRESVIKRAKSIVYGYAIFWSLVFLVEFANFFEGYYGEKYPLAHIFQSFPGYIFAFRGIVPFAIIFITHWSELTWDNIRRSPELRDIYEDMVNEGLSMKPHLNSALRAEILYFTTQGIMYAAKESSKISGDFSSSATSSRQNSTNRTNYAFSSGYDFEDETNVFNFDSGVGAGGAGGKEGGAGNDSDAVDGVCGSEEYFRESIARLKDMQTLLVQDALPLEVVDELNRGGGAYKGRNASIKPNATSKVGDINMLIKNPIQEPKPASPRNANGVGVVGLGGGNGVGSGASSPNSSKRSSDVEKGIEFESYTSDSGGVGVFNSAFSDKTRMRANSHDSTDVEFRMTQSPLQSSNLQSPLLEKGPNDNSIFGNFGSSSKSGIMAIDIASPGSTINGMGGGGGAGEGSSEELSWEKSVKNTTPIQQAQLVRSQTNSNTKSVSKDGSQISENSISSMGQLKVVVSNVLHSLKNTVVQQTMRMVVIDNGFSFKDYRPKIFAEIRSLCGISPQEYASSFTETTKQKFSEGRSGAFMFYSKNEKYLVKTTTKSEMAALLRIIPLYRQHLLKPENARSQLCRYLGAHRITMYGQDMHFVVMKNAMPTENLSEKYDLKGSWVNRHGKKGRLSLADRLKMERSVPLYQDNDFYQKISLSKSAANELAAQIRRDVLFMRDLNLMDYSLLIGVVKKKFDVVDGGQAEGGGGTATAITNATNFTSVSSSLNSYNSDGGLRAVVVEGPGCYYFGIIDILQEWNWKKKLERFYKMYIRGKDGDGLSCMEPIGYADRFLQRAVVDLFDNVSLVPERGTPMLQNNNNNSIQKHQSVRNMK